MPVYDLAPAVSGQVASSADYNEMRLAVIELGGLVDDLATSAALAAHVADTSTHGVAEIVGTTEVQTLTNKTLTAPIILDLTNMAHDHGDADDGGQLVNAALPTNITVGGTLTVTGATTTDQLIVNDTANPAFLVEADAGTDYFHIRTDVPAVSLPNNIPIQGFSDNYITQTWVISGAGNAQFDGTLTAAGAGSLGSLVLGTALAVAQGGTGATTAAAALTNLGLTATAAELNFTDGVTSAIQAQLDGKQPLDADLTTIAGLTATTNNFIVANASAWSSRTPAQAIAHLGLDADLATFSLPASTTISAFGATLVDDAAATNARTTLGVGTADSPEFAAINLGHASDTTITRVSAGNLAVEGNALYRAGGTDVALADGGTGASLADPNADRVLFWDDSAGAVTWLAPQVGVKITDTEISGATEYANVADSTGIGNTTSLTDFDKNYTIPANTLAVGDVIRVRCGGVGTTDTGTVNGTFRITVGGQLIGLQLLVLPSAVTNFGWRMEGDMIVRTIGAAGTMRSGGGSLGVVGGGYAALSSVGAAAVAIDTTTTNVAKVSLQLGAARALDNIRMSGITVEILRAKSTS